MFYPILTSLQNAIYNLYASQALSLPGKLPHELSAKHQRKQQHIHLQKQ